MLFYFAGHGIALDGDNGPEGYLIAQDAHAARPESFPPIRNPGSALDALPCRHRLAILHCCFAGSFRWAGGTRAIPRSPSVIHKERYRRYLEYRSWQVITLSAHEQKAVDARLPGWRAISPPGALFYDGRGRRPISALFLGLPQ